MEEINKLECIDILTSLIITASQAEQTETLKRKIKALEYARDCVEGSDIGVGSKEVK